MSKLPIGTFINMAAVVIGSLIGLLLLVIVPNIQHDISLIAIQALAIGILILGIQMVLKIKDEMMLILIISLILGGVIGEWIELKEMLEGCKEWFGENIIHANDSDRKISKRFFEGLVAAFVLFCASPITIVGSIEEGIQNKRDLLIVKSFFDGIMAIVLTSTFGGIGVLFSIIPMLVIQGGLTMIAGKAKSVFTKSVISQISAVGGALLIALAVKVLVINNLTEVVNYVISTSPEGVQKLNPPVIPDLKVASLIPAFLVVLIMNWVYSRLGLKV